MKSLQENDEKFAEYFWWKPYYKVVRYSIRSRS
jgi:hypothetical protein